ncbi:MAG: hypothetical protein FWF97_01775 [Alphaproteobacteria bacterium]|nr:hypothetical protein [Alphaproteobacteria bacterium]
MMPNFPNILSSYNPDTDFDLLESLKRPGCYRWNKGVELYQTGLPVYEMMLINPKDSDDEIMKGVSEFMRRYKSAGSKLFVVRPDAAEPWKIPPPSNSAVTETNGEALKTIRATIDQGFTPSLWALGDYRANRLGSTAVSFLSPDKIMIEMVGPGHDVASIAKNITTPPIIITMKSFAPPLMELNLSHLRFYIDIRDEAQTLSKDELGPARAERRKLRIEWLAKTYKMSVNEFVSYARGMGWNNLFEGEAELDFAQIEKLFKLAIKYAQFKHLHNLKFAGDTLGLSRCRGSGWIIDNAWDSEKYK